MKIFVLIKRNKHSEERRKNKRNRFYFTQFWYLLLYKNFQQAG